MTRTLVPVSSSVRPRNSRRPARAFRPFVGQPTNDVFQFAGADIAAGPKPFDPLPVFQNTGSDRGFGQPGRPGVAFDEAKELFDRDHTPTDTGYFPALSTGTFPLEIQTAFMENDVMSQPLVKIEEIELPHTRHGVLKRIELLLADLGKTAEQASVEAGLGKDFIRDLRRGKTNSPSLDNITSLSSSLETNPEYLAFGTGSPTAQRSVRVIGEVASGVWRDDESADMEAPEAPVSADLRFAPDQQCAFLLRGNSIDKIARPPVFLICVRPDGLIQPVHGDIVVAERRRVMTDGSRHIERSACRFCREGRTTELRAESTDSRIKPLIYDPDGAETDGVTVAIVGVVVQITRPMRYEI